MKHSHILSALALLTLPLAAQVSFTGNYSENFNSMGTGTAPPAGWSHIGSLGGSNSSWTTSIPVSGAQSAATAGTVNNTLIVNSAVAGSGTSNTQAYNFALAASTADRCLGTSPTSGAGNILQLRLTNNTASALNGIRIGYDIRRFNAPAANDLPGYWLFYSINGGSTWTNISALNPTLTNVPSIEGVTNIPLTSVTFPSSVAVGAEVRLRWIDDNANQSSPDQIIGLDNVSVLPLIVNALPTASLTTPTTGATYDALATVNLAATAADTDGTISKVEFFNGATKLGEDTLGPDYDFVWNNVITGNYSLTAVATDNLSGTGTSTAVNVTVTNSNNAAPTVSLTSPANNATILTNSVSLAADAADTDGVVSKVEFFNGTTKLGEDLTSPYTFNWTGVATGNYALTAVATDNDTATTTSSAVNISVAVPISSTLIARRPSGQAGAVWKYLDNGTDQGTAWKETAFDDSTWASGAAPLGYTDSHIVTTVGSPAAPNRYITTYLRRTFNVTNAAAVQALNLNVLRDDGVVVFINGTEVARQNMPAGAINHLTNSSTIVDGADETTYFASPASPLPLLNEGANTIAVELHQRDGNSSDLGFDLELISLALPGAAPTVALTAPTTGSSFPMSASINLTADAADTDGTITKVEFFAGATKLGEATGPTFAFLWSGMISGPYVLTARATDNIGNTTTSAPVNITITNPSNVAPTVALTAPSNNATILINSVSLAADAADTDGVISKVEFFNGTTKLGEDLSSPFTFNWTSVATGNYTLTAVATDNDTATTTSSSINISIAVPISTTLVAKGATWKYLDNGSDQGTAWREITFNDSTWASGAAPLGYGDTHIVTTVGSPAAPNRHITTYFRRTFNVSGAAAVQSLNLNIMRDDGVVVYINGTEVARQNMPTGAINHLTNSSTIISGADETTYFNSPVSLLAALVNGSNTIAVELHQRDGTSSDLGFDLEMISLGLPGTPPTVALTTPLENASYSAPATVSITADAADTDGNVTKVEFFAGATKLGEDTSGPTFEFTWNTVPQGSYSLTARATDNFGLVTTSAPVNISVGPPNTSPPVVCITAPTIGANFTFPASIEFIAEASDSDGTITKVEFFNGATKIGDAIAIDDSTEVDICGEPFYFNWLTAPVGTHTITAIATDNLTATASASITITVNPNQPPTISQTSPANLGNVNAPSGTLNVSLNDPENQPLTVTFYGRPKVAAPGADFTVVTLPDTQFYSENSGGNRFQLFTSQTNWIVASKNLLNTQFVAHMGDMTQSYNTVVQEYINASQAMGIIENPATTLLTHGIPWGGAPGNHDIRNDGSTAMWNDYFGTARFATRTVAKGGYFGGGYMDGTTDNNYQLFSASGMDFIVINLKYNGSTGGNTTVMNWADALLKAHPSRRAIITSHFFINTGFPASWGGHGQAVYDNLKDNPNLFLMLCGHIHGEGRRADTFEGRTVNTVLQDYQSRSNGGDSWLRYFTFSPANNTITAKTYKTNTAPNGNPLGGTFETDADSEFTLNYNMTSSAPWTVLGTQNLPSGSTSASAAFTGLVVGEEYEWYAAVTDGVTPVSTPVRSFTAVTPPLLPTVTIAATDAAAGEFGTDQAIVYTITRTGSTAGALSVQFTPSGNASAADYSGYSGISESVIIPIGEPSINVSLTVLADTISEGPESLTLTLNPAPNYNIGAPSSALATIADQPAEAFYLTQIADPALRAPTANADGDQNANIVEYFMGTLPADGSSFGVLTIPSTGENTFKVRYPRAKNRADVTGSLRWSTDLTNWHTSGQSNGTQTVTFVEAVVSAEAADPETVEATATITGPDDAPQIFVRLGVE